ncbi:gephyrin-like isoform X3 [Anneissia japonica]|uniref:gephyrin-like isoform X3 n=1 Tax=Anneissia japonica TaxID=1529436 RepID=UPI0014259366|nr:gephyrin-like isoform X3 [Anneissia japonica]
MAEKEHNKITFGILTVSDSCFNNTAQDKSGLNLKQIVEDKERSFVGEVVKYSIVPDEIKQIKNTLVDWSTENLNVILTTGGTGFTARDVTPEATRQVLDKEAPGLVVAMLVGSLKITPFAMLSRPVCGIRGQTLIVNLPGSAKGSKECLDMILPSLKHAVHQLRGNKKQVATSHASMTQPGSHQSQHHSCSEVHHDDVKSQHCKHKSNDDVTKVARRMRHSPYPITSFEDAVAMVMNNAYGIETEVVDLKDALGRVLANDVLAKHPVPPFPASIKDGYAVLASDGSGIRHVSGNSTAGSVPLDRVTPGVCVRITTGAPIPPGADAVVQVEDTKLVQEADDGKTELEINVLKEPEEGQDIRPVGVDIQQDQVVVRSQQVLGPAELGLVAMVGVSKVRVFKMPVVAVFSTGNELCVPGEDLKPGCVYDSNKTMLLATLKDHGYPVLDVGVANDNLESLQSVLKTALCEADVVVSTGGVSMGEKDLLKHTLSQVFNALIHFGRVFLKPGKPTTFATVEYERKKKLVFALPGNPVSAIVTCNLFILPALRKMCGHLKSHPTKIKAKIERDIKLDSRPEFHRVVLSWNGDDPVPLATSTGNQMSSRLLSMLSAQALLQLPPGTDTKPGLKAGDLVDALIIGRM